MRSSEKVREIESVTMSHPMFKDVVIPVKRSAENTFFIGNPISKQCPTCGIEKPIKEFYANRKRPENRCKTCISEKNKKYRNAD